MAEINQERIPTSATRLSLNDRFTKIAMHPVVTRSPRDRSNNRSRITEIPTFVPERSESNVRLIQELVRKHKMQTALKLKRRSMRVFGGEYMARRDVIKALRVGPSGKPIKTKTLARTATMKADYVTNNVRRPMRQSETVPNRVGARQRPVGGAAERVAKRRMQRMRNRIAFSAMNNVALPTGPLQRGRSRSRSRVRLAENNNARMRSNSRGRNAAPIRRGRSRSRTRINVGVENTLPIKARLGVRRQDIKRNENNRIDRSRSRNRSIIRRRVANGRIEKRINTQNSGGGVNPRLGRPRVRTSIRNTVRQSRSRTRKGLGGQLQRGLSGNNNDRGRRGRSQQRNGKIRPMSKSRKGNGMINQQQRRRRSRSRGGRGSNGRNQGNSANSQINKDDLDKELDQYMSSTKSVI